jgi:hypothetical protein
MILDLATQPPKLTVIGQRNIVSCDSNAKLASYLLSAKLTRLKA